MNTETETLTQTTEAVITPPTESVPFTIMDKPPVHKETPAATTTTETTISTPVTTTTPELNQDGTVKETTTTTSTQTTDTPATPAAQPIELTSDQLAPILSDATEGFVNNVEELHSIIEANKSMQLRLQELEKNPVGVFKDPQQAAIAKFLLDYKGGDFHTGIQTYAKLQSLDIPNMKAEDALRESYIMDKSQVGISRTDAEAMFSIEFDKKYGEYGEHAEKFINADAYEAKRKLDAAKQTFTAEKPADSQVVAKEQAATEARQRFEQDVEKATTGFKSLTFAELTENPANDFTFEVENPAEIADAMNDYQGWFNSRYGAENGGFNTEQMKQDLTLIQNYGRISQELFNHGRVLGKEEAIMERNNIPNRNDAAISQHAGDGSIPQSMEEALKNAKISNHKPS